MTLQSKTEYFEAIQARYSRANKAEKSRILDEYCENCNFNRKYAIRKLTNKAKAQQVKLKHTGRKPKYNSAEIKEFLIYLYKSTNLICSKRLVACIPLWLDFYPKELKHKELLLTISSSTIDRILHTYRGKYSKKGLSSTKPGSLIKKRIPISKQQWDAEKPGFIEADTVAHCGTSLSGSFVYTLNFVDIATGWIESRALWGKGQMSTYNAIADIESKLPFKILGFDSDNGSEFINYHLLSYFTNRKHPVIFTRSRPYMKNDNAHIEGKNWTHIRQYLGYNRIDNPKAVDLLNSLFSSDWSLFFNFFIPSVKLISKTRVDGKIIKSHDKPKTPFQRLLDSNILTKKQQAILSDNFNSLNPFSLQSNIFKQISFIFNNFT